MTDTGRHPPLFVVVGKQWIEVEWDEGELQWVDMPPPDCAGCGASLGQWSDEDEQSASIRQLDEDNIVVECDNCGETYNVKTRHK